MMKETSGANEREKRGARRRQDILKVGIDFKWSSFKINELPDDVFNVKSFNVNKY